MSAEAIESTDVIMEKAIAIEERGDPMKFLIFNAQRQHLGDIPCQKIIILAICSANSLTSSGIQPGFTGESGSGKDDTVKSVYMMVPDAFRFKGSLSAKTLLYSKVKPGSIIYSPDVEYDTIIPIFKIATGDFQDITTHKSVNIQRKFEELVLAPRQVWLLTSVESVANLEAANRQFPISTESSDTHKKIVSAEISRRRARPELRFEQDEAANIGKAIFQDIYNSGPFKVIIPQSEHAEWLLPAEFRGQNQFWDLVDAFTILRFRQRETKDGWLVADDRDITDAIDLMLNFRNAHTLNLTPAEVELVQSMAAGGIFTQAALSEMLNLGQPTISKRLESIMSKTSILVEVGNGLPKKYKLSEEGKNVILNSADIGLIKIDGLSATDEVMTSYSCDYAKVIGIPMHISININKRIPDSLCIYGEKCKECINCNVFNNNTTMNDKIFTCPNHKSGIICITDQNQYAEAQ
jgi:DNA-binding CsgD family transcriptional regulator